MMFSRRKFIFGAAALAAAPALGFAGWIMTLPPGAAAPVAPSVPQREADAMLAALARDSPARPLIAVVGINDATEITDYLVPAGLLRRADIADVVMLATGPGPVRLYPALRVVADASLAEFDAAHPRGADYVIVPAMRPRDDPQVLDWLRAQSARGAVVIGICAGAMVVAAAGLLRGRRATTHWYYLRRMLREHPSIIPVRDRRMVADGRVVTTTGITASMPMMLTLIEAIAGRARAGAIARGLGIATWDARHASAAFRLTRPFALSALRNRLAVWRHEVLGLPLDPGMDEVALALAADGWSRTGRARVLGYAAVPGAVRTANGLRILPDRIADDWPAQDLIPLFPGHGAATGLDLTLAAIAGRYGARTRDLVAMQLEYPPPGQARR